MTEGGRGIGEGEECGGRIGGGREIWEGEDSRREKIGEGDNCGRERNWGRKGMGEG